MQFKYASDEEVQAIIEKQPEHEIGPKDSYTGFEALRDMRRHVRLFRTDYSPFATLVMPLWLLYHRMWAPLSVVLATCTVSALVNPILFMLVYLLLSIYFHKAQTTMMRSYALYLDYNFWFVFAERSTRRLRNGCDGLTKNADLPFHTFRNQLLMRRNKRGLLR